MEDVPDFVQIPSNRTGKGNQRFPVRDVIHDSVSQMQLTLQPPLNVTVSPTKEISVSESSTVAMPTLAMENSTITDQRIIATLQPSSLPELVPTASIKPNVAGTELSSEKSTVPTTKPLTTLKPAAKTNLTSPMSVPKTSRPTPKNVSSGYPSSKRSHSHQLPPKDTSKPIAYYTPSTPFQQPYPVKSLRYGHDYPWDHINDVVMFKRVNTIVNVERIRISAIAARFPYRVDFYSNYLKTHTEEKRNGRNVPVYSIPPQVLKRQREGIMDGVSISPTGECDGCKRKNPIPISDTGSYIRKFVGNTEVFNIFTNGNGDVFCTSLFLAVYPNPNLPFNVTIVSVTSYSFSCYFTLVQIVFSFFLKSYLDGQDTMYLSSQQPYQIDRHYFVNWVLFIFLHELLPLSIH